MTTESRTDDAGITLVELLITVLVATVILGVVATVFFSTLQANAAARDRDLSTGRVQAISTSLSTSIRTAGDVTVQSVSGGGAIARAAVLSSSGWTCAAWAVVDLTRRTSSGGIVNGADGNFELRYTTYATLGASGTSPAPSATWKALAEKVKPIVSGGTTKPYFVTSGATTTNTLALTWNLSVSTSEQPYASNGSLAALSGSAAARGSTTGSLPRC